MADLQYTLGLDPSGFGAGVRAGVGFAGDLSNALRGIADLWEGVLAAFEDTAAFESTTVAINTMTKDMAVTRSVMADLAEFAASTPFEMPELAAASRQLIGAGTAVSQVKDELRVLGDISSGANTDIGGIVTVLNQVRGKAVLLTDDFQQLAERGVAGLRQELAQVKGIEVENVAKAMSDGKIGAEDLMQAFRNMTSEGGQYFEAMADQSKTFNGTLSSMKDDVAAFMREFEAPSLEMLKPVMAGIGAELKGMTGEARVFMATLEAASKDNQLGEFLEVSVSLALARAWKSFVDMSRPAGAAIGEAMAENMANSIMGIFNHMGLSKLVFGDDMPMFEGGFGDSIREAISGDIANLEARYALMTQAPREDIAQSKELDRMGAKFANQDADRKRAEEERAKIARAKIADEKKAVDEFAKIAAKQQDEGRKVFAVPKSKQLPASPMSMPLPASKAQEIVRPIVDGGKQAGQSIGRAADKAGQVISNAIKGPSAGQPERKRINARIEGGVEGARARSAQRTQDARSKSEEARSKMGSLSGFYGRKGNTFGNLDYGADIQRAQASTTPTKVAQAPLSTPGGDTQRVQQDILKELQRIRTE